MRMAVNRERNERITVTLPRDVTADLRDLARRLTDAGIGQVTLSDLLREGAKKILAEAKNPLTRDVP